jgi:membrane peptidoglycan carboxypeptidase
MLTALVGFVALSAGSGFLAAGLMLPAAAITGLAAKQTIELFDDLPASLNHPELPQQSNIYASDGTTLIATFFTQNRVVVPLEEISPWIQKATVDIEDHRFWKHNGVDGESLVRAIFRNASSGDTQGASTLTQQLVKNTLINDALARDDPEAVRAATEVTISRKLHEAKLALALEEFYNSQYGNSCDPDPQVDCGKERILEQYLNMAQFGKSLYGVETASEVYFGKHAAELNALEAATIAGITQNPYKWDPLRFPENTQIRRDQVLKAMFDQGDLTEAEYNEYLAISVEESLDIHPPHYSCVASAEAPFFCDYVTKVIAHDPFFAGQGEQYLYEGVDIVTTLDITMQRIANEELQASLPMDDPTGLADALVAIDPTNGHIKAMSQNRVFDPGADGEPGRTAINYAVDNAYGGSRGFSPGSTFKIIILAEWLNSGRTLEQVISGGERAWKSNSWIASCVGPAPFAGQRAWKPGNAEGESVDQIDALGATVHSINTAYVAMANQLDLCNVALMAQAMGFVRADGIPFETVPSISLGTQNASPLTMAVVGATVANHGVRCEPRAILSITKRTGEPVDVPPDSCVRVMREDVARGVEFAMTEVVSHGTGTNARLKGGRPAAGKTGTSQNNAHTWFLGFTPQLVAVTWLGNPDKDVPMQFMTINHVAYKYVYGSTIATPLWKHFMDRALEGQPIIAMQRSEPSTLGGHPLVVPEVRGETLEDAKNDINDAGFRWAIDAITIFDDTQAPGTVELQSVEPGESLPPGAVISIAISRNTLPDWWTTWPTGWNPCVAPSDWWGSSWPPATSSWGPATGWSYAGCGSPTPSPSPTPAPT